MKTFIREKSKNFVLAVLLNTVSINCLAAGLMAPTNGVNPLEIQSHEVSVNVEEGFVTTEVTQVFSNPSSDDLEAIYSFPVPKDAAIGGFTYWIDGVPVHGEVLEKEQARDVYEQEKAAGREAALVEKDSYKKFDILVSPVRANDNIKVKLVYLQETHLDLGIGRYVYQLEDGGTDEVVNNFWSSNSEVEQKYDFNIKIRSGYPVEALRFPSNPEAVVSQNTHGEWLGKISNQSNYAEGGKSGKAAGDLNKDVVVYWKHKAHLPASIDLKNYKNPESQYGTFSLNIVPGDILKEINRGKNWIFVLDISGSMEGKIGTLVDGVSKVIEQMDENDRVKIITFSNYAHDFSRGYVQLTPANKADLLRRVNRIKADGGTNLYAGLKEAVMDLEEQRTNSVILITDGVANVGVTEKKVFYKLLDENDIRLFTFVMGNGANEPLLAGMAKHSNGFAQNISNFDDIIGQITWAMEKVKFEAFHDVAVEIDGIKTRNLSPKNIGSIYKGQQINLYGRYYGTGPAKVKVKGKVSGKEVSWEQEVQFTDDNRTYPELERLWAYSTIKSIEADMDKFGTSDDSKQAIKDIAIDYGLVTDYTSMIVVREEVFNALNIARNNAKRNTIEESAKAQRQQAPLPQVQAKQQVQANPPARRASFSGGGGGGSLDKLVLFIIFLLGARRKGVFSI